MQLPISLGVDQEIGDVVRSTCTGNTPVMFFIFLWAGI